MSNINDYLKWRGDISLKYDELNEIAQVIAEIKPKKIEEKILLLSLDNYPAGTEVVFTLKDSEIYE